VLVVLGFLVFALIMWFSPTVPIVMLGGFAVALVLLFPVRWLSYVMPPGFSNNKNLLPVAAACFANRFKASA
jgi:hypothetical protein